MSEPTYDVEAVTEVAEFRAALRRFLRQSEKVARSYGLTPQRYLLLLMIKGAPDGSERSTVTSGVPGSATRPTSGCLDELTGPMVTLEFRRIR